MGRREGSWGGEIVKGGFEEGGEGGGDGEEEGGLLRRVGSTEGMGGE